MTLPWNDPYECWKIFFYGGIAAFLADKLTDPGNQLDPGLRKIADEGTCLRVNDYVNALLQRSAFWQKVRLSFEANDLLITPTLSVPPFPVGQDNAEQASNEPLRHLHWTQFTYPFNLTGQPAISVPCSWTKNGLPVGLQIVGRRFDDATVLRAARALEQLQPWAQRRPPIPVQ